MSPSSIHDRIRNLIESHDVVLFMKGSAPFPMCGFSGLVVQVLKRLKVPFQDVDVLQEADLRQGIKDYTRWPTIPQLYVKGDFIGGSDIVRELYESGELQKIFQDKGIIVSS